MSRSAHFAYGCGVKFPMTVYHGTTTERAAQIRESGFAAGAYATPDRDYAELVAGDHEGTPEVLEATFSPRNPFIFHQREDVYNANGEVQVEPDHDAWVMENDNGPQQVRALRPGILTPVSRSTRQ